MESKAVMQHIFRSGIVATLPPKLPLQDILKVGDALLASPLLSVQIPWQSGIEPLIADLKSRAGKNMVVGVSDVETAVDLKAALTAGAQFVLTPRYDRALVVACHQENVLMIPTILSTMAANAAYQNGIQLVNLRTGGPQGADFVNMMVQTIPDLKVAVGGDYTLEEVTQYAHAGASAMIVQDVIYEGEEQTMADVITQARAAQKAWDTGLRQRRGSLYRPSKPSAN